MGQAGPKPSGSSRLRVFQPGKVTHVHFPLANTRGELPLGSFYSQKQKPVCLARYAPDQMLTAAPVSYREGCILLWRRASDQVNLLVLCVDGRTFTSQSRKELDDFLQ